MNREQVDELLNKYEQGLASQEEMDLLMEQFEDSRSGPGVWFNYLRLQKRKAPENLHNQVWSAIQSQEKKKKQKTLLFISAAASLAILISIIFISPSLRNQKEMTYEEKAAKLEEAQSLLSEHNGQTDRKIIYEDEIILIYTE